MEKLLILIFFAVLSLLLAATGVSYRKKSKTLSGYIAADRSVSFFAGAFSSFSGKNPAGRPPPRAAGRGYPAYPP